MRIFYILSIILLITIQANSQNRINTSTDQGVKLIKFYPNPAISQITFNFEKGYDKSYSFQIFNFIGKKVFEVASLAPKTIINLAEFYRGFYIFQVRNQAGKIVESGKFQVAK